MTADMIYELIRAIILIVMGAIMMTISWLMWRRRVRDVDEYIKKQLDEMRQHNS